MAITFRNTKGSPLTHEEMDFNLGTFYVSSSVDRNVIKLYSLGSGSLNPITHSLTIDTGSDNYKAGLGLDLESGSNTFSIQNAINLNDNVVVKWDDVSGQLVNSIISADASKATIDGDVQITGSLFLSGTTFNMKVDWPAPETEYHLLEAPAFEVNGRQYQYSAIAMENYEQYPGYFENAFRIYTQDSPVYNYGSDVTIGPTRIQLHVNPSGSNEIGNLSVQDLGNGETLALFYATELQIGVFNGDRIYIGNAGAEFNVEAATSYINAPLHTVVGSTYQGTTQANKHTFTGSLFVTGTILSDAFVTRGGTSASFVKGDGTLDYNEYIVSGTITPYTAGTGIDISASVITNTAPDQTVSIEGENITVNGTYPNFQITGSDVSGFALLAGGNVFTGIDNTFQNIIVNGTGSFNYIQSITGSAKIIGDAFVVVNNNTPVGRYAGLAVYDSGSINTTGSFFFDGNTNDWNYEYSSPTGTDYAAAIFGPSYSTKGVPTYLNTNRIPKSDGTHHLLDSNISDNGSTVSILTDLNITGSVTAVTYYGDGSNLTGITGSTYTAGTGLTLSGSEFNNTAPDQTVSIVGQNITVNGTYPNFQITGSAEADTLQTVTDRGSVTTTTITAANFITTSDRRLKSDVEPLKDGLDTIKKFISYEYVKDGVQDAGFMAQEVQQAIPYAIAEGEDGFLTMRDRPVLAYMHKAILELEARLAAIEEKLK